MQATMGFERPERVVDEDGMVIVKPNGLRPDFAVDVKHTDVEGKDYIHIEAHRTFSSPGEVNAWLNLCKAELMADLVKMEAESNA